MSSALSKSYELGDRFSLAMEEAFLGAPAMLGGSILKGVGDVGLFFSLKEYHLFRTLKFEIWN